MSAAMLIIQYFFGSFWHFVELVIVLGVLRGGTLIDYKRNVG